MSLIEGGRWDAIARKLFNISAPSAVPNLSDEVLSTFEIQNWEPELYALRRERLLWGTAVQANVVGEFANVGLTNPPNSGVLLVVDQLQAYPVNTTEEFLLTISDEELTTSLGWTLQPYGNRDLRWPGGAVLSTTRATARLVTLSAAVRQGNIVWGFNVGGVGGRQWITEIPMIIPPDTGLIVASLTESTITASFSWRERPFNQQETP